MEQIVEPAASSVGNAVAWMAESGLLLVVFASLWIAFAAGIIWSQGSIDQAWESIRDLPLLIQIVVWVLFLPVMVGLWIWETSWSFVLRLLLVVGIAGWNLLVLLPKAFRPGRDRTEVS